MRAISFATIEYQPEVHARPEFADIMQISIADAYGVNVSHVVILDIIKGSVKVNFVILRENGPSKVTSTNSSASLALQEDALRQVAERVAFEMKNPQYLDVEATAAQFPENGSSTLGLTIFAFACMLIVITGFAQMLAARKKRNKMKVCNDIVE